MKPILLIALLLLSPVSGLRSPLSAQTPAPSTPSPYDALHAAPAPRATPIPLTLAQQQAQFHQRVVGASQTTFGVLMQRYLIMTKLMTTDDSTTGGLTPAQKTAALSTAEQTELMTNAWLLANLLNGIQAGSVPNPPSPPTN
jgi:hypothetical protein